MKPYPSVFHAGASKLRPPMGLFEPTNIDEASNRVPPTSQQVSLLITITHMQMLIIPVVVMILSSRNNSNTSNTISSTNNNRRPKRAANIRGVMPPKLGAQLTSRHHNGGIGDQKKSSRTYLIPWHQDGMNDAQKNTKSTSKLVCCH